MGYMPTGAIVMAILSLGMHGVSRSILVIAAAVLVLGMLLDDRDRRWAKRQQDGRSPLQS